MARIDLILDDQYGMHHLDFPDQDYWCEWDAGTNPTGMVRILERNSL